MMPAVLSDAALEALVPAELRHLSAVHGTGVEVARRAAAWLAPAGTRRVLDVGCGVGKLCAIGALTTDAIWTGVEQHRSLVDAAIEVARALDLSARTRFVHADALALDWSSFDALYFYNPFETQRVGLDATIAAVQARLATLRPGTRVVTYHGLGGALPAGYRQARREDDLELWVSATSGSPSPRTAT
jgi:SAM-dependent methyltransferase